jgi:hypothetical protein
MNRQRVSDPNLRSLGNFQGTIDRNSNFLQQALDHNLGRNIRVAKVLGYLALLRQRGASLTGVIQCVAAQRQNFSSSKSMTHMSMPTGPTEAAHFLPGHILIGSKDIWNLATNPATRGHIEFLFGEVEHLPAPFNQADTVAEAKGEPGGLCSALVHACKTLVGRHLMGRVSDGKIPLDLVQSAYGDWHLDAVRALNSGAAKKSTKPGIPPLVGDRFEGYTGESIAARSDASTELWNRDDSLRILQYYIEDQQQRTWQWVMKDCREALREVESNFKG